MEHLEELGSDDLTRSSVLLRLLKLVFGAVSLFSEQNESVLQPHLSYIIERSMELAITTKYASRVVLCSILWGRSRL